MKHRHTLISITVLILSFPMSSFPSDRTFERAALAYHRKLMDGNFQELENDAKKARAENATISDGQPLLSAIYGGISGCEDLSCSFPKDISEWNRKERILEQWLQQHPESITAQIGYAAYYIQLGWFHRGGGYSNTISKESWRLFKNNIEKSRLLLENLPAETRKDAGWSQAMVGIALYQGWPEEDFNLVYEPAVNSHPTYIPLYFSKAAYMEPKWHGSLEKFNAYVDSVVEDTMPVLGHQMYARLHWSGYQNNLFRSGRTDWVKMKQGFEELIENYPDPWNINNYAKFSCLAGDMKKLKELLGKIGEQPLLGAWDNSSAFYIFCEERSKRS